jgi:hypothetical protein
MSIKAKVAFFVAGGLLTLALGSQRRVQAQAQQEVEPYEFAHIPVPFHTVDVKVYKMVHQGCEIYVTTNSAMGHEAASIAIATGRGCK